MNERAQQSTSIPCLAHGQVCYLQIPSLDVAASARFYERVFGWRVDPPEAGFEAPVLIGQWVTDRAPAPEAGPVAWLAVGDVRRTLEEAERAGATRREGPIVDGPRLLASFTDPAGNLVGIAQHGQRADAREPAADAGTTPLAGGYGANRTMPPCTIIPELVYDDVLEAVEWLCDKFGFVERWHAGDHRAQLSFGDGTVAITEPRTSNVLPGARSVMVRVDDARAHHDRARARGATILREPEDFPYGERQYTAEDLGGHHWTFSQSIADRRPEDWGGTAGPALTDARFASPSRAPASGDGPAVSVMLIVPDAAAAIAWYKDALGAGELWDLGGVAGLHIEGAPFFIHEVVPDKPVETSPDRACVTSTRIELFVEDPDRFVKRALAAGATAGASIEDHQRPWGTHRQGGFRDPFGHNWSVGDRSPLSPHHG